MKKQFWAILVLLGLNTMVYSQNISQSKDANSLTLENIETLSQGHESCFNGGIGSTSCSISAGIHVGFGFSEGCSVSCGEYYYACCEIRCYCVPYTPYH